MPSISISIISNENQMYLSIRVFCTMQYDIKVQTLSRTINCGTVPNDNAFLFFSCGKCFAWLNFPIYEGSYSFTHISCDWFCCMSKLLNYSFEIIIHIPIKFVSFVLIVVIIWLNDVIDETMFGLLIHHSQDVFFISTTLSLIRNNLGHWEIKWFEFYLCCHKWIHYHLIVLQCLQWYNINVLLLLDKIVYVQFLHYTQWHLLVWHILEYIQF